MAPVLLGLGSNLGERRKNLRYAAARLQASVNVERISPVYSTEPWGVVEQPEFLNICLAAETNLSPIDLLDSIKSIERAIGRKRSARWGPRHIDIDILFYNDLVIITDRLTIPHPGITERAFVLAPLADIAPHFVHPVNGKTIRQMLLEVGVKGISRLSEPLLADEGKKGEADN